MAVLFSVICDEAARLLVHLVKNFVQIVRVRGAQVVRCFALLGLQLFGFVLFATTVAALIVGEQSMMVFEGSSLLLFLLIDRVD